jgi:hypothetical protein
MNKLIQNIETELISLKKETYFLVERIQELESALVLAGGTSPANGNQK